MNIAFLLGGFSNYGGIGRVSAVVASRLSEEKDTAVTAVCLYRDENDIGYAVSDKIHREYLFDGFLTVKKALLKGAVGRLKKILVQNKIDVVVACGTIYYPLALFAARRAKIKCVMWEHIHPNSGEDHFLQDEIRSYAARRSDANVLIADRALTIYNDRFPHANNTLIYNPLDPAAFRRREPYGKEHRRILSVGRLSPQKNYLSLLRVAKRVLPQNEGWQWDIYGEGECRAELESAICEMGLVGRVNLMGQHHAMYDLYQNYDFQVMTSRFEGFPMVLLEGIANALPLISYDIETGPNEIVFSDKNGFLIPSGDEDAMAQAVQKMICDPAMRLRFSKESAALTDRFSLDAVAREWMTLFGHLKGE